MFQWAYLTCGADMSEAKVRGFDMFNVYAWEVPRQYDELTKWPTGVTPETWLKARDSCLTRCLAGREDEGVGTERAAELLAALLPELAMSVSSSTVCASSAIFRAWPVLVCFSLTPDLGWELLRMMDSRPRPRSTWRHRSAEISPRRGQSAWSATAAGPFGIAPRGVEDQVVVTLAGGLLQCRDLKPLVDCCRTVLFDLLVLVDLPLQTGERPFGRVIGTRRL